MRRSVLILQFALIAANAQVKVPFVGCAVDGQIGPLPAPVGSPKRVALPPRTASQLAYYETIGGLGVLGPRGWYCLGIKGSSGDTLELSPKPFSGLEHEPGPAIHFTLLDPGASGNRIISRILYTYFPNDRRGPQFTRPDPDTPLAAYRIDPHPQDQLVHRPGNIVEYTTPPKHEGLGTFWAMKKDPNLPTRGLAMLVGPAPFAYHLSVRLPAELSHLATPIIRQVEMDRPTTGRAWQNSGRMGR